jgi:hypothetical protein
MGCLEVVELIEGSELFVDMFMGLEVPKFIEAVVFEPFIGIEDVGCLEAVVVILERYVMLNYKVS